MASRFVVVTMAVGLLFFVTLSAVLGGMLAARTIDSRIAIDQMHTANRVYLAALREVCPAASSWIDAFRGQEIPVEYMPYDRATHALPVQLAESDTVKYVLVRTDGDGLKFGRELLFFDVGGCPIVLEP